MLSFKTTKFLLTGSLPLPWALLSHAAVAGAAGWLVARARSHFCHLSVWAARAELVPPRASPGSPGGKGHPCSSLGLAGDTGQRGPAGPSSSSARLKAPCPCPCPGCRVGVSQPCCRRNPAVSGAPTRRVPVPPVPSPSTPAKPETFISPAEPRGGARGPGRGLPPSPPAPAHASPSGNGDVAVFSWRGAQSPNVPSLGRWDTKRVPERGCWGCSVCAQAGALGVLCVHEWV